MSDRIAEIREDVQRQRAIIEDGDLDDAVALWTYEECFKAISDVLAALDTARADAAHMITVAAEAIGTDAALRSSACVDVLAQHAEDLGRELAAVRAEVERLKAENARLTIDLQSAIESGDLAHAKAAEVESCNRSLLAPFKRLREAVGMPAEGEGAVINEAIRRLSASEAQAVQREREAWDRAAEVILAYVDEHGYGSVCTTAARCRVKRDWYYPLPAGEETP